MELGLGGEDGTLSTNLRTLWRMLRPSWCPHPPTSLNKEVMEQVRLTPGKDEDLGNLNVIHKLILPHRKEFEEVKSKPNESSKNLRPGSCITLASGGGEHSCDGPSCVRIQFFQRKDLATWFSDNTEKEKNEKKLHHHAVSENVDLLDLIIKTKLLENQKSTEKKESFFIIG